ncbi:uncharacterized protein MYCGRDRAFT_99101 [Zymoseptoria tritici IPO323]|uniref:Autophagy-related protein 14 n=1 Tax=Zymoseptoria tritici (strain CBS 115943 / IPO323) TaxID=336722 RepID=F9X2B7_ZYMTI|nr:uncharacterized protein MYCGRDRAFT_99101 [Zymoseptoria tritici IPO323]EGP90551.1 hypothetical protein MYCGRDRAFT_99101 [Zymoseptoria tritici IPO323]
MSFSRAERPWLLPYNHKLRNLLSISLRNLSLDPKLATRSRGKTIDDDALPQTLNSPAKLVALREQQTIGHSRSSTDLRADSAHASPEGSERPKSMALTSPTKRPELGRTKRRSTMEWATATPQKRQQRLEAVTRGRMADVFFSLHVDGIAEPVYVSETVEKTMNPTFRSIDWSLCGPAITSTTTAHFELAQSSTQRPTLSSSFDALLRLSKLDDSIQDALAARDQLARDLEDILRTNKAALTERDQVAEAEDRLKTIDFAKRTVQKQLEKARKQSEERRVSLETRRSLMTSDAAARQSKWQDVNEAKPELPAWKEHNSALESTIQSQRRRICEDLQKCYPIQPVPGKTLAFSIRELHLPNSEQLDSEPPEVVSAALGHIAHTLQLMAFYLSQSLPYPVMPRGSTSTVYDPVSILKSNTTSNSQAAEDKLRLYPLFSKGVPRFRYEYGVFLLNENIRVLLENTFGLKVLDIRQTLPNLKYLLYVATAGEGELPGRKMGGIRGLTRPRVHERAKGAVDRLREISGAGPGQK